jgi:hypothetical protein
MARLSISSPPQPVALNSDERNGMFDPITTPLLHDASRPRCRYDTPPVVTDAPWWARTKALAAHLSPSRRPQPARAPQTACGVQGR